MSASTRVLVASLLALAGCGPSAPESQRPASLVIAAGDDQVGSAGEPLSAKLSVRAFSADGRAVPRALVKWSVASGGGNLHTLRTHTDADGIASVVATLGPTPGPNTFEAVADGVEAVVFRATGIPGAPSRIELVSGGNQTGDAESALANPLVVRVLDRHGNGVIGAAVSWTAPEGGRVDPLATATDSNGVASARATLGPGEGKQLFWARAGDASLDIAASAEPIGLVYRPPAPGGKLRLERNSASSKSTLVLELVATQPLRGFSAGFNLPVDERVRLVPGSLQPGVLDPGTGTVAAVATIPPAGPMKNVLVVGISQKASGAGATAEDRQIPAGAKLLSVRLELVPGAAKGPMFDPAKPGRYVAGLRDKAGNDVVATPEVAVGRLEVR